MFINAHENVYLLFSNDGSTDNTLLKLQKINSEAPGRTGIYNLAQNKGKAEAVREGINHIFSEEIGFNSIAYLDADGSTSADECYELSRLISDERVFVFGSRVSMIDNRIDRKWYRHLIGRVIATLISRQLKIAVYDTQCGCKIIKRDIAKIVFKERFISKWLFDVEIFNRLINIYGRPAMKDRCLEVPLKRWVDTDGSKVPFTYFFKIWSDLNRISRAYKM
jgi:glycosyltransferase involved in cell wall biosynthesis